MAEWSSSTCRLRRNGRNSTRWPGWSSQRAGGDRAKQRGAGDGAEGYDMGMAIDGASFHDSQCAVFGSDGSVKGANDVEGTWVHLPAVLMTKAAGQTRHRSSTLAADHGERAVYGAFPEPVNRADRCPSYPMHVSRHDRGDDLTNRGAVQTLESFQLANEAKFEECVPQPVSVAVGLLVPFQQRAARLAAGGCDAGTDIEDKENVKEMVAEVVEWILSGTATNDAPSAEMCRDGNAQAEELVSSPGMIRQDDGTEAGSDSTEEPHAALPEVMTPVAWEFLNKLRTESGRNAGCVQHGSRGRSAAETVRGTGRWCYVKRVGENALILLYTSCG